MRGFSDVYGDTDVFSTNQNEANHAPISGEINVPVQGDAGLFNQNEANHAPDLDESEKKPNVQGISINPNLASSSSELNDLRARLTVLENMVNVKVEMKKEPETDEIVVISDDEEENLEFMPKMTSTRIKSEKDDE